MCVEPSDCGVSRAGRHKSGGLEKFKCWSSDRNSYKLHALKTNWFEFGQCKNDMFSQEKKKVRPS